MQELGAANTELKGQLAQLQQDASVLQIAAKDEVAEARQQLDDERAAADAARRQAAEAARGRQEADEAHHARIHDLQKRCTSQQCWRCLHARSAGADVKWNLANKLMAGCTWCTPAAETGC